MVRAVMTIRFSATLAIVLATFACRDKTTEPAPASHQASGSAIGDAAATAPANPVQIEMRMLTDILAATVRGIGARDVRPIEHELHRLHAAKEATTAAVRSGAYKLPKNPDGVAQFEAMDEAFHEHLGSLVMASRANEVPATAEALGAIMRGCHGCHEAFRP